MGHEYGVDDGGNLWMHVGGSDQDWVQYASSLIVHALCRAVADVTLSLPSQTRRTLSVGARHQTSAGLQVWSTTSCQQQSCVQWVYLSYSLGCSRTARSQAPGHGFYACWATALAA